GLSRRVGSNLSPSCGPLSSQLPSILIFGVTYAAPCVTNSRHSPTLRHSPGLRGVSGRTHQHQEGKPKLSLAIGPARLASTSLSNGPQTSKPVIGLPVRTTNICVSPSKIGAADIRDGASGITLRCRGTLARPQVALRARRVLTARRRVRPTRYRVRPLL